MAAELYRFNPETNNFVAVSQADNCRSPVGPGEVISVGASSTQSATPFPSGTNGVRLVSTVDTWIEIGTNPTAAPNISTYLVANTPETFPAAAGQRVAALQVSAAGQLFERPVN